MSDFPPTMPPVAPYQGQQHLRPHRATVILVLGILGLVACGICGIIAWVMANTDLRDMQAGLMDPSGEGMTRAGKIIGIVAVALNVAAIGVGVLMMMLGVFAAAAGSAQAF